MPQLDELDKALSVFICCVKIAYTEKLLGEYFDAKESEGFFS